MNEVYLIETSSHLSTADYILLNRSDTRGFQNIFSRHQSLNLPEVQGDPPTPPPSISKERFLRFWCQNSNIWYQNSNILRQNSNSLRQNSNIWPKFKINEFLYHKKPPALWGKTSRREGSEADRLLTFERVCLEVGAYPSQWTQKFLCWLKKN